jgi:hypothetical protein
MIATHGDVKRERAATHIEERSLPAGGDRMIVLSSEARARALQAVDRAADGRCRIVCNARDPQGGSHNPGYATRRAERLRRAGGAASDVNRAGVQRRELDDDDDDDGGRQLALRLYCSMRA